MKGQSRKNDGINEHSVNKIPGAIIYINYVFASFGYANRNTLISQRLLPVYVTREMLCEKTDWKRKLEIEKSL